MSKFNIKPKNYKAFTTRNIDTIPQFEALPSEIHDAIQIVSRVMPFRANNYVIDELIDWSNPEGDPIFKLIFPQKGMMGVEDYDALAAKFAAGEPEAALQAAARDIQLKMNPHPAGQMELNVPKCDHGQSINGIQHKYKETVLFFPTQGQVCHAYCTYCFRWAQFVGVDDLKFACGDPQALVDYLEAHPEVTNVLFTGGDPMIMTSRILRRYVEPILEKRPGNVRSIRFGTKVLAYWPYRFLTDKDADDLMGLFDEIVAAGFHLAVMSHFSHPRELETDAVQAAISRILSTGANIRCQAPLIRHINDDPEVWRIMWEKQVALGAIPYYMFVERDTGPKEYFSVPLVEAYRIFTEAYSRVSGLARTVRGPSMSATPGKVLVDGIAEVGGEKVMALKFIQARNPDWVNKLFFAEYDEKAVWLDGLKPAFGEDRFFFERQG
ncbi:KamA family radical SAM protein [Desulfoluna spongiiphila]|uniref:L-lysine 2,3-aminomutase n=1 Tax=Desulfoluna spongiiphila TaxID=419481 RepID=A0A1G5HB37_9BACT|nr:lysine 2,3-aminomutase [Desulfoluna spongiiphila]SCY60976.1 L-lysine 2,3-aminomutase [Desulfoluna spongiiphila]